MKHLKTFEFFETETGQALDYGEGDIVICSDEKGVLDVGTKYKVLRIYNNLEDKYLNIKYRRVDVENMETGEISNGWESTRFQCDTEFDAIKFNL
jgi:hypothetical protein